MKVIDYELVEYTKVKEYIDNGWQPWGSAIPNTVHQIPHQPMVRYEEK